MVWSRHFFTLIITVIWILYERVYIIKSKWEWHFATQNTQSSFMMIWICFVLQSTEFVSQLGSQNEIYSSTESTCTHVQKHCKSFSEAKHTTINTTASPSFSLIFVRHKIGKIKNWITCSVFVCTFINGAFMSAYKTDIRIKIYSSYFCPSQAYFLKLAIVISYHHCHDPIIVFCTVCIQMRCLGGNWSCHNVA